MLLYRPTASHTYFCSGGTVPWGHRVTWPDPMHPGSEQPVRSHPSGSRGSRRCAFHPFRARHRAALQPRGRLGGGPDFGVFEGGQVRRLRPPGVKLRPPGTLVVPLVGVPIFGGWGTDLSLPVRKSFPVTATPPQLRLLPSPHASIQSAVGMEDYVFNLSQLALPARGPSRVRVRDRRAVGLLTHRAPFCD